MRTLSSPAWGNIAATVTSEHNEDNGIPYGYQTDYCMLPNRHAGLDIALACGSTLYAIGDGYVTCAGTGIGSGSDASACSAYNNEGGFCSGFTGQGRVQLQLDADHYLIYGHCSKALVPAGWYVSAGDPIALSGGAGDPTSGGSHLHIEYRVRDASCNAGWRIENCGANPDAGTTSGRCRLGFRGDIVFVNDDGVNFRDEAGTSSEILLTLNSNTRGIVMNQNGPTYKDGHDWYKLLTRFGRGWVASEYLDSATGVQNRVANPTANSNLQFIEANRSVTVLDRVSVGGSYRVKFDTLGSATTGEGVRYESARGLAITGTRYFGGVINQVKAADTASKNKLLDFIRVAAYFSDGTTKYSSPVKLTITDSWKGVVSGLLEVPSGKTIDWLSLQIAVEDPTPLLFYTDNALIVEL